MLIIAKTKKKVRRSDELDYSGEAPETLEILIKEAKGENGEIEDTSTETKVNFWSSFFVINVTVPQIVDIESFCAVCVSTAGIVAEGWW